MGKGSGGHKRVENVENPSKTRRLPNRFCSNRVPMLRSTNLRLLLLATTLTLPGLAQPPSEMREVIERYNADRGSLSRFYTIESSPKRRAKLEGLATQTLADLTKLDFESFGQEGKV